MGLAGRKEKQRIPNDPRNLSWADDAARFGQSYMSKLGWDPSKGLGASGDGMKSHLKVSQKLDMLGIGAAHQKDPHGIAWKQNKDFEALLQRLNAQDGQDSASKHVLGEFVRPEHPAADAHSEEDKEPNQSSKKEKKRKRKEGENAEDGKDKKKRKKDKRHDEDVDDSAAADSSKPASPHIDSPAPSSDTVSSTLQTRQKGCPMAHRARIQAAKRLANKSAAAISEILGIAPTPSSSTTPSGSLTPITPADSDLPLEKLTTSTKSVADYFKEKLNAKSGSNTPAASDNVSTSRGGIGSSAPSRDDVDRLRIGLGASRSFGEGGSSNVFAQFFNTSSSSHATVVQMASSAIQAIIQTPEPKPTPSTGSSRDEEMTEKQRRKAQRKEERKKRDAEVVDVPTGAGVEMPDDDAKVEKKKRKEERKAKGVEPYDLAPSVVVEESEEDIKSERERRKDDKKKKKAKSDSRVTTEEGENRSKKSKKRTEPVDDDS